VATILGCDVAGLEANESRPTYLPDYAETVHGDRMFFWKLNYKFTSHPAMAHTLLPAVGSCRYVIHSQRGLEAHQLFIGIIPFCGIIGDSYRISSLTLL
jgi:hypothetical protein